MSVLTISITIVGCIAVGAVIAILIRKHMREEHTSDEDTQLRIDEQYRRMYNDKK